MIFLIGTFFYYAVKIMPSKQIEQRSLSIEQKYLLNAHCSMTSAQYTLLNAHCSMTSLKLAQLSLLNAHMLTAQ